MSHKIDEILNELQEEVAKLQTKIEDLEYENEQKDILIEDLKNRCPF